MATFTINKKGGYEVSEVDGYIKNLEQQLNEYKDKSSAITKAIISAQVASDNMIKASQAEASKIIQNAKEEANEIKKQAEAEKTSILNNANDRAAELKKNSKGQLTEIKANLSQQKDLVSALSNDYDALINKLFNSQLIDELTALKKKYADSSAKEAVNNITAKIDEIDSLADELADGKSIEPVKQENSGVTYAAETHKIPDVAETPKVSGSEKSFSASASKPFTAKSSNHTVEPAANTAAETPKPMATFTTKPVTATFAQPKSEASVEEKPFIKTGLNNGSSMNGIPVQKTYDEPSKSLGNASTQAAPTKPGIYRVPTND